MYTVGLILKPTFQTLSGGLWSKHTRDKMRFWGLQSTFFQFLDTLHIFGHGGFPYAHVVFCL